MVGATVSPVSVRAAGAVLAAVLAASGTVWVPGVRRLALAVLPEVKVTRSVSLLTVVVARAMGLAPLPVEGRLSPSVAPPAKVSAASRLASVGAALMVSLKTRSSASPARLNRLVPGAGAARRAGLAPL